MHQISPVPKAAKDIAAYADLAKWFALQGDRLGYETALAEMSKKAFCTDDVLRAKLRAVSEMGNLFRVDDFQTVCINSDLSLKAQLSDDK